MLMRLIARTGLCRLWRATPRSRRMTAAVLAIALGVLASCDDGSPTMPLGPPAPAPVPTLVRVEVSVPPSIAPGESVQVTAHAVKSDASVEDVTAQVQWISTNSRVLEISSGGIARAVATGDARISARYQNRFGSAPTIVVPAGTFRLTGRVSESGLGLANVAVTVISGVGEGLVTMTSAEGAYALYGVSGPVRLQAKQEGYANRIEALDVLTHRVFDFEVTPDRPRPDLGGSYAVTLAAGPCFASRGGPPPAAALNRSYGALVTQDGPRLLVTLTDADFIITRGRGNHFAGLVDAAGQVTFAIGDAYYYQPVDYSGQHDLVERFNDRFALTVSGIVTARVTPAGLSGTLAGGITLRSGTTTPFTSGLAFCYSNTHRFEMSRR